MTVINIPAPATIFNSVTVWASSFFDEFSAVMWVSIGLFGAALILLWFSGTVQKAIAAIFGKSSDSIF